MSETTSHVERRLAELGLELPPEPVLPPEQRTAVPDFTTDGPLLYLSGTGPFWGAEVRYAGKLGADLGVEDGCAAAQLTLLNHLSALRTAGVDLDRLRWLKVFGMVNCTPGFDRQPTVVNGYSDLLIELYGRRGVHARSAVGFVALPMQMAVEIEAVVRVDDA
ncbi:MAG TPA: RidA family protein [Solirubrobacter sp.]|nr:RidA family protein [Solirubrobacter sp.]